MQLGSKDFIKYNLILKVVFYVKMPIFASLYFPALEIKMQLIGLVK